MADMKEQITASVRQIDELNQNIAEHWSMVQKSLAENRVDSAISLLNAYFRIKMKLNQVESSLESILRSYFSDK